MKLSNELKWRGFVNQTTYADMTALDGEPMTFYWGVDPSADSMTIGHLAVAMMVRRFIENGHKAILLVGGATGLIGDPDGKKQERELKTSEEIDKNVAAIVGQYQKVFAGQQFEVVNNADWFKDINYLDFLREVGKHMPMTQLLDREFVKSRIGEGGSGISYAEFSYSLIQGYDFLHLSREKGVTLQVCGADQWGNSLAGVELIRRLDGKTAHVYSVPLIINKTTGVKFGKSEEGAVWLDPKRTSPYQFYQFWLNVDDAGAEEYLKIYTSIQPDEYDQLMNEFKAGPADRAAQKYLAFEVTRLVHGETTADNVRNVTNVLFGTSDVSALSDGELELLVQEIPTVAIGSSVAEALTVSNLASSNGEARRLIASGAVSLNGQKITDDQPITKKSLLKKGKNSFVLVK